MCLSRVARRARTASRHRALQSLLSGIAHSSSQIDSSRRARTDIEQTQPFRQAFVVLAIRSLPFPDSGCRLHTIHPIATSPNSSTLLNLLGIPSRIGTQATSAGIRAGSNSRLPSATVWHTREADEPPGCLRASSEQSSSSRDSRWAWERLPNLQNHFETTAILEARHNHNSPSRIPRLLQLDRQDDGLENQMDCSGCQEAIPAVL